MLMYVQDYDEQLGLGWIGMTTPVNNRTWYDYLQPYIKNVGVYRCPSSARRNDITNYGYYSAIANRPLAEIVAPADTVMFTDAVGVGNPPADPVDPTRWTEAGNMDWEVTYGRAFTSNGNGGGQWTNGRRPIGRHSENCNVAFIDGHVKAYHIRKLVGPLTGSMPEGYAYQDPQNLWDNF